MAQLRIKGFGIFKNDNENIDVRKTADKIGDALSQYMLEQVIELTDETGPRIAAQISREATKTLRGMMPYIATNIIGRWNGGSDKTINNAAFGIRNENSKFEPYVSVNWSRLKEGYLKSKQKRSNPNFFYLSGALQKVFLDSATSDDVVRKLGGVNAAYISNNKSANLNRSQGDVEFGRIEVQLMPGRAITGARFGATLASATGAIKNSPDVFNPASAKSLDKYLFSDSPDIYNRLQNKGKSARTSGRFTGRAYRPLLQPSIAVYLLYRIPLSIQQTLSKLR